MLRTERSPFDHGSGPGPQSADGCSVEVYLRVPYFGEVELLKPWLPGVELLELGCAVGRVTQHLLEHGYRVTAVDNSPQMLAHVPAAATRVLANIEDLALEARFDAVLLASNFINVPSAALRSAFLATCFKHLRVGGRLVLERYDPAWLASATPGPLSNLGDVEMHLDRIERRGDDVEMSLRYRVGGEEWWHHSLATPLDDEQIAACLAEAGFDAPCWIDRCWASAAKTA
jgi:SAM-dependent methyltransferase